MIIHVSESANQPFPAPQPKTGSTEPADVGGSWPDDDGFLHPCTLFGDETESPWRIAKIIGETRTKRKLTSVEWEDAQGTRYLQTAPPWPKKAQNGLYAILPQNGSIIEVIALHPEYGSDLAHFSKNKS